MPGEAIGWGWQTPVEIGQVGTHDGRRLDLFDKLQFIALVRYAAVGRGHDPADQVATIACWVLCDNLCFLPYILLHRYRWYVGGVMTPPYSNTS